MALVFRGLMTAMLAVAIARPSLAAGNAPEQARDEVERELQRLASTPPPRLEIDLLPVDRSGYVMEAGKFELDGKPLPMPADFLDGKGAKRIWSGQVGAGRHELTVSLVCASSSGGLFSYASAYKARLTSKVYFQAAQGLGTILKIQAHVNEQSDQAEQRVKLEIERQERMLAKLDDGSMPAPPRRTEPPSVSSPQAAEAQKPPEAPVKKDEVAEREVAIRRDEASAQSETPVRSSAKRRKRVSEPAPMALAAGIEARKKSVVAPREPPQAPWDSGQLAAKGRPSEPAVVAVVPDPGLLPNPAQPSEPGPPEEPVRGVAGPGVVPDPGPLPNPAPPSDPGPAEEPARPKAAESPVEAKPVSPAPFASKAPPEAPVVAEAGGAPTRSGANVRLALAVGLGTVGLALVLLLLAFRGAPRPGRR
jgi:hypothetical protein